MGHPWIHCIITDDECIEGKAVVTCKLDEYKDNQVWFYDGINGVIRSKVNNNFCLEVDGAFFYLQEQFFAHGEK